MNKTTESRKRRIRWTPFATAYYAWLRGVINLEGFGHKLEAIGIPKHWNPRWKLVRARELRISGRFLPRHVKPDRLTKRHVQCHHDGDGYEVFYFTGGTGSHTLVNLDTDAHNGEPDGDRCNAWVASLFGPTTFVQPSPRGGHGFVVLEKCGLPDPEVNVLLRRLAKQLEIARKTKGFRVSGVEVKGLIQHEDPCAEMGFYCGVLARLPRVWDNDDLKRLRNTSVVTVQFVRDLIDRLANDAEFTRLESPVLDQSKPAVAAPPQGNLTSNTAPSQKHLRLETKRKSDRKSLASRSLPIRGVSEEVARLRDIGDTTRRLPAVQLLCRLLGRLPTEEEAMDFLRQQDLYSPPWEWNLGERLRDVRRILVKLEASFDAKKLKVAPRYDCTKLAKALLAGRDLRYNRGRSKVTWQDVVTYLLIIDECVVRNPNLDGSVPHRRVESLWGRIASRRKYHRAYHESKQKVIREYLVQQDVLEWVEGHLPPRTEDGVRLQDGKAMRFTIGPRHPAYGRVRRVIVPHSDPLPLDDPHAVEARMYGLPTGPSGLVSTSPRPPCGSMSG